MQPTSTFYLDKSGDPFADTLAAHGLAALLREVLLRAYGTHPIPSVRMVDCGAYFQLDCSAEIGEEAIARASTDPLYLFPAIRTVKNADSLAPLPDYMCLDYEAVRDKRSAYFDWLNALPREQRTLAIRGEFGADAPEAPHRHWDILRAVNPAALPGHNSLALSWWTAQDALPQVLYLLLEMAATTPNSVDRAVQAWKELDRNMGWGIGWEATALQLFNPSQGKGQNRAKANALTMGNVSGFWLLEWLKVAGFYQVGVTRQLSSGDRKSYVLAPLDLDGQNLDGIMHRFRPSMVGTESAVRMDVLMALRFTRALLEYVQENEATDLAQEIILRSARPRDIVGGFHAAFYKDLGNAVATMNLSFIALPGWVRVQDAADVATVIELLDEHEQIVRQFDESHSDEVALLQAYRDFLSGDDLAAFFAFTTRYAAFIMSRLEASKSVRLLAVSRLERMVRLLMNALSFSEITQDEGFRQIAYAIRNSTVVPQRRKALYKQRKVAEPPVYDIRYGLHHELNRAARRPELFVSALSEFLTNYNAETAQVFETKGVQYRNNVETSAIERMLWLIDRYKSAELICNLLIAYGYAYDDSRTTDNESEAE